MESEFSYPLTTPIEYASGGEMCTASFVTFYEPTQAFILEVGRIRQWLQKAMQEVQDAVPDEQVSEALDEREERKDAGEEEEEAKLDGPMLIAIMANSSIPLDKFYATAETLLKGKGIAELDGSVQITPSLWKKFTAKDFEGMIGAYVATFLVR